ncbi:MAG: response regulator [Gammaproteobacteria bacterium]|nr:response regulator [Gammaproteobacteria bacterium]MDH5629277.1 response regulator [Gammaproteobacteria bacterium]
MSNSVSSEAQNKFLRRVPVKLRQFSRLLDEMTSVDVEVLRVKALASQVNKVREMCQEQDCGQINSLLGELNQALSQYDSADTRDIWGAYSKNLMSFSNSLEKEGIAHRANEIETSKPAINPVVGKKKYEDLTLHIATNNPSSFEQIEKAMKGKVTKTVLHDDFDANTFHNTRPEREMMLVDIDLLKSIEMGDDKLVVNLERPLICFSQTDDQVNRIKALRNFATGFFALPADAEKIIEQIEMQNCPQQESYRVLVMDDSRAQAKFYEKALSSDDFEICLVNDPTTLLKEVELFEPEVIFMDMQMPKCSGVELTSVIRQIPKFMHLPIIFLSAEENLEKQQLALMAGGVAFLVKPPSKELLNFYAKLYSKRYRMLSSCLN